MPLDPYIARGMQAPDVSNTLAQIATLRQRDQLLADNRNYDNALLQQKQQEQAASQQEAQRKAQAEQVSAALLAMVDHPEVIQDTLTRAEQAGQLPPHLQGWQQMNPADVHAAIKKEYIIYRAQNADVLGQAPAEKVGQLYQTTEGYLPAEQAIGKMPLRAQAQSSGGVGAATDSGTGIPGLLTPEQVKAAGLPPGTVAQNVKGKLVVVSKPDYKRQDAVAKVQRRAQQTLMQIGDVESTINDALSLVGPTTTGFVGGNLAESERFGKGTDAWTLKEKLQTIKANIGFDRLQAMRESSPTGGALGQVAIQELTALQASIASLNQGLKGPELEKNLRKVLDHYSKWKQIVASASQGADTGGDGGGQSDMPDPAQNEGRVIRDTDTGQTFISNGSEWVPQ
jgi:hypothetical protein